MDRESIFACVKCIFVGLFIIFAVIGNGSVLYAISKYKKLKTVPNLFVLNLALADLMFAITGMPMILVTTIARRWILGDVMCQIVGLLNSLFCSTSIWTLVMISVHRYISVSKARQVKMLYTRKRTYFLLVGIWLFALCIAMPPLFGWSQFSPGSNFCVVDGKKDMSYSIFLLMIDYFCPFIFLSCLYFTIFFLLKKHETAMKKSKPSMIELEESSMTIDTDDDLSSSKKTFKSIADLIRPSVKTGKPIIQTEIVKGSLNGLSNLQYSNSSIDTQQKSPNVFRKISNNSESDYEVNKISSPTRLTKKRKDTKKRRKVLMKEVKVTKMLLIVILGFFSCWTPFLVASVLYAFDKAPKGFHLVTFGIMTACLNSVINPIIYAVMNNNFRFAFTSMYNGTRRFFAHFFGSS